MTRCLLLTLLLLGLRAEASPFGLRLGLINDNYTGSRESGETGRYLGSDDFLTVSYFLRGHYEDWTGGLVLNTVTSRRHRFRYDLLQASVQRTVQAGGLELSPGLGLLAKGDFGGAALQNGFHRMRDLPEVHLPYRDFGVGGLLSLGMAYPLRSLLFEDDELSIGAGFRLATHHVPSRIDIDAKYLVGWGRLEAEILLGLRGQLSEVPDYSELVRSGPVGGVNLRLRLLYALAFEFGLWALPVQGLESDPGYQQRDPSYSPQISMVLSWNAAGRSLRELMDY